MWSNNNMLQLTYSLLLLFLVRNEKKILDVFEISDIFFEYLLDIHTQKWHNTSLERFFSWNFVYVRTTWDSFLFTFYCVSYYKLYHTIPNHVFKTGIIVVDAKNNIFFITPLRFIFHYLTMVMAHQIPLISNSKAFDQTPAATTAAAAAITTQPPSPLPNTAKKKGRYTSVYGFFFFV